MSLSKKIAAALDENTKAYVLPCTVTVEDSPHRLTLNLSSLDTVGLAFSSLEYASTSRTDLSSDALQEWGDGLTKRVTYLMEPLKVVEADNQGGEVQVRSQNPTPRADERGYYEMRLFRQGSLRMERIVFDAAARQRRPTNCQLTREVLERLADDIAGSFTG
jgi:hypothetical protein